MTYFSRDLNCTRRSVWGFPVTSVVDVDASIRTTEVRRGWAFPDSSRGRASAYRGPPIMQLGDFEYYFHPGQGRGAHVMSSDPHVGFILFEEEMPRKVIVGQCPLVLPACEVGLQRGLAFGGIVSVSGLPASTLLVCRCSRCAVLCRPAGQQDDDDPPDPLSAYSIGEPANVLDFVSNG